MKVLILSNNKLTEKNIKNELTELQKIVGGYIEIPYLSGRFFENDIDIIINEEGKFIDGMKPEIAVIKDNKVLDIVYGNCIFASHDVEGNTIALNTRQMNIVAEELSTEVMLTSREDEKSFVVKGLFI